MTRRGSLAYYLVSWVVGCLFMSLAMWLPRGWEPTHWTPGFHGASGFLAFYFLGLIFGAFTALLFALFLRKVVAVLGRKRPWQWILLGAGLAELLVWGLGAVDRSLARSVLPSWLDYPRILLLAAPAALHPRFLWVALPVGAATAFVLRSIQRAFGPEVEKKGA